MKYSVTIDIDTDKLWSCTNQYIAQLWHVAQANPAPIEDYDAGRLAEAVGREIIRRWLKDNPGDLWNHQGHHAYWWDLGKYCVFKDGKWVLK